MVKYHNMTWTKLSRKLMFSKISHTKEITGAIADTLNVMYIKLYEHFS